MRIIHTEASLGWGGQEIRILTEAREFIAAGTEVLIFANAESLIYHRSSEYKVPCVKSNLRRLTIPAILALRRAILSFRPDIVVAHSSKDHWIVSLACCLMYRPPRVVRIRHISTPVRNNFWTRWLYRSGASRVVTTSESIRAQLIDGLGLASSRVESVPTGIDLEYFSPKARLRLPDSVSGAEPAVFTFGTVSTLRSWKGHSDLLRSFASITTPNSRLIIVGSGPMEAALKAMVLDFGISSRVKFFGHQSDTRPYYEMFDCFVFPSYANEGVPQGILQAMAYGLPIITTSLSGIQEALGQYQNAFVLEPRDVENLSKMMEHVARDRPPIISIDSQISKRISITNMTKRMKDIYESLR